MRRPVFWIFISVAMIIVVAALVLEWQRRQALERVAMDLGFAFTGGQHALPESLDRAGFYLFTQGQPLILNRMDGERAGYQVSLFGFGYHAGKGDEGSRELPTADVGQVESRLQTVVWLHKPGQVLPDFDLSPSRHVLRRIGPRFGLRGMTFDGRPDFQDRYLLAVRDEAAMRRIFRPPVIDAFAVDPGWFIEGRGDQWLVYRLSERVSPAEIPAFLDRAIGLIERLAGLD
jgi:hypothetical protein